MSAAECSGARERGKQCRASEQVSGARELANKRASSLVHTSEFLVILDHSEEKEETEEEGVDCCRQTAVNE